MKYTRVLFICNDNTALSPMAAAIFKSMIGTEYEVYARGTVVLFSEPYNPKIFEILKEKKIIIDNGTSKKVNPRDFIAQGLVLTMDAKQKQHIYNEYDNAKNVYTIKEFAGESGDIIEPFGQGVLGYTKSYEELVRLLKIIKDKVKGEM